MSRNIGLKVIAVLLAALSLLVAVGSVVAVIYLGSHDLYTRSPDEVAQDYYESTSVEVADYVAHRYAEAKYGSVPEELWDEGRFYSSYEPWMLQEGYVFYTLRAADGQVESNYDPENAPNDMKVFHHDITPTYPIVVEFLPDSSEPTIPIESTTMPQTEDGAKATAETIGDTFLYQSEYWGDSDTYYHIYYYTAPTCNVTVYLSPAVFYNFGTDYWWVVNTMYTLRNYFLAGAILGVLCFIGAIAYLTWAVGRKKGSDQVHLVGLNRLPLDLYGAAVAFAGFWMVWLTLWLLDWSLDGSSINFAFVTLACAVAIAAAILAVLYYCAIAAQVKLGGGHWWRNSIVGRVLRVIWKYVKLALKGIAAVFTMLPIIWQWLLTAAVMGLTLLITFAMAARDSYFRFDGFFLLLLLAEIAVCIAIIFYVGYAFGVLMKGARRMSRGDLTRKISTKYLTGFFRDCANHLNALADVAVVAAQKQLKSERMKTELITNVSHDIKTPLTSIINFVDLLQKPHTQEQGQEYLAVLDRQSQRLKKLIEDLMELSKASTGNIQMNLAPMDACEAINQALGEFADKLAAAQLTPVFRQPQGQAPIMADGRLVWRILSNVLSNAVKYALPGTRIYVDVVRLEGKVLVSLKNISREQLNVSAEELMERFVRGDASRNTEGSGLGLNIAKSLMDVQHGQLQLLVDGDLFKVTLIFPSA